MVFIASAKKTGQRKGDTPGADHHDTPAEQTFASAEKPDGHHVDDEHHTVVEQRHMLIVTADRWGSSSEGPPLPCPDQGSGVRESGVRD